MKPLLGMGCFPKFNLTKPNILTERSDKTTLIEKSQLVQIEHNNQKVDIVNRQKYNSNRTYRKSNFMAQSDQLRSGVDIWMKPKKIRAGRMRIFRSLWRLEKLRFYGKNCYRLITKLWNSQLNVIAHVGFSEQISSVVTWILRNICAEIG